MSDKGFTHLHLHSQYSLLDGAINFDKLLKRCKELQMDAVAVTDHGNMFGAIEFYTKALTAHIKPILGIEAYIAPGSRFDKQKSSIGEAAYHLILLAENNIGYQNLLKLASIGFTEGFYYRPRIDKEILAELNDGIICTSACLKGELATLITNGKQKEAVATVESYLKIFGHERFFIEIQSHEGDDPEITDGLIDLAQRTGVGLVATNDVHFLQEDDYDAHNCLCCISTGKLADDPNRMIYPRDIFLQSPGQMRSRFGKIEQACDNTLAIANRCNLELDLKTRHAPAFVPDDNTTAEEFLTKLCYKNAKKIYGTLTKQVEARIERELEVIKSKGFASYFLIVWDFCDYAHKNNIAVGARGSAVGTVVGYCLGICNIDPLKYDLLFERFMDPQRNEMPDIDIDICQEGRGKIIDYVRHKYGHVAQIITFGTMKARAAIRDVCRVKNIPLAQADKLAKLIPDSLGITLDRALRTEPQLKDYYEQDGQIKDVIDISKKLEGLARHASTHAAGVVIADKPLTDFLPIYKAPGSDDIITQYEGPMVEKVGLLKMDFLGLKTLSILELTCRLVSKNHSRTIDMEKIDLADKKVFEIFASGRTKGIFQFESSGMQDLLMKIKPDRLEDLIAANALYRPGPMVLINDYIDRKHGAKWKLPHPVMTEILNETYGIMVYQEQVMRICNRLGDIPLREAYALIKAIGKKRAKTIERKKEIFITGCTNKGLSQKQAEEIFELIERFAGYGFNKSHSTRYAFIAYQTAYMKTYWPVEFMAAVLTYEKGNTDKIVDHIAECTKIGIKVLPPDINESLVDFTPLYKDHENEKKGVIRFGLAAVKGVGEKAVEQIIAAHEKIGKFRSLFSFCENVDLRAVNKQVLESLIKSGAFDRLGGNRAQMIAGLEKAMQVGSTLQSDKQSGQMNFFAAAGEGNDYSSDFEKLPQVAPWPEQQMLTYEKEVLGFYVTANPLSQHAEVINTYSTIDTSQLDDCKEGRPVVMGGIITKTRSFITKSGRNVGSKMAVFTIEDLQGSVEAVLFPDALKRCSTLLANDRIVFVKGRVAHRRENPNVIVEELIALEDVTNKLAAKVRLKLNAKDITKEKIAAIKAICQKHKGNSPLYVTIRAGNTRVYAEASKGLSINPDIDFCRKIKQVVGKDNFQFIK